MPSPSFSGATPAPSSAANRSWSSRCPPSRPGCRRRCWSGVPTSCRPSSSSSRPTPRSARPGRCISRRSRSPAATAQASAICPICSRGLHRVWSYGGSITGPIFAGGAIYGQVIQAEAGQKEALLSYQAAIQSAFSDVENALVANQKLVVQQQAQERLVRANQEYARLARLQYKGGYVPYSTVLQAEQQLFPSELTLAQTRAATFSSLVAIYQAMGGGWVVEAEKRTASADAGDVPVQEEKP